MSKELINSTITKKSHDVINSNFEKQLWNKLDIQFDDYFSLDKEIHNSLVDTVRLRFTLFAAILIPIFIVALILVPRLGADSTLPEDINVITTEIDGTVTEIDSYLTVYNRNNYGVESDFNFLLTSVE